MRRNFPALAMFAAMTVLISADEPAKTDIHREALSKVQSLVGDWRGVGQVQRGSNKGAWTEKCQWKWIFAEQSAPALALSVADGKHLRTGVLRFRPADGSYTLNVKLTNGGELMYAGKLENDQLVVESKEAKADQPARISIRQVAGGDRLLCLLERPLEAGKFARLAEVGYTREGSSFGQGTNYVECIVTGGHGTIPVTYKGKEYFVCCSGCRDYFNENPETVLAEYQARRESAKKKK